MRPDPAERRFQQEPGGVLDGVEPGDGGVDHHPHPAAVGRVDPELGVGDGLPGGRHRELREPGRTTQTLALEDGGRVEVRDLGGDPDGQVAGVEGADLADPRPALQQAPPGCLPVEAERGDRPEPGDHNPVEPRRTVHPAACRPVVGRCVTGRHYSGTRSSTSLRTPTSRSYWRRTSLEAGMSTNSSTPTSRYEASRVATRSGGP